MVHEYIKTLKLYSCSYTVHRPRRHGKGTGLAHSSKTCPLYFQVRGVIESLRKDKRGSEGEKRGMAAYIAGRGEPIEKDAPLSTRNVSRLPTYELRQELVRRDLLGGLPGGGAQSHS